MKRTNIMLTGKQHKEIKAYAKRQGKTLGSMVREALDAVYEKRDPLEQRRQTALDAYREGLISLGKLAEVLGLDPISARLYLRVRGIPVKTQDREALDEDAAHA